MKQAFLDLLWPLDRVCDPSRHHPERNVLYHSLQVFSWAKRSTEDPDLLAAALLHDVGKAVAFPDHAAVGAELLEPFVSPRVVELVELHLDLLRHPNETRVRLCGTMLLADLEALRRWDLAGRSTSARAPSIDAAVDTILDCQPWWSLQGE